MMGGGGHNRSFGGSLLPSQLGSGLNQNQPAYPVSEPLSFKGGPGEPSAARLIVVSNRVPAPNARNGAGGLAVALEAALKAHGGIWFGWSGEARPAIDADALKTQQVGRITFATTDLTKRDVDDYYLGFSNRALWPVCHYRLDLASFRDTETQAYFRVNELFARKLAGLVQPDDLIWVHDYHLIPLGAALRERSIANRIGFFLHIPWPPCEIASALPAYGRLLRGLAAYDVVGFQTERDAEHFGRCLVEEGIASPLGDGWFAAGERRFRVAAFPIGIDTAAIAALGEKSSRLAGTERFRESLDGRRLVIGVDRLDYSKGLRERVRSVVEYLHAHPGEHGRITYLQITPKSRSEVPEYAALEREIATLVGEANGGLGDVDWTPIRYLNQNVQHATLTGLYRLADIGLVTPLRDGMNLVAKEYVASQNPESPGVLILSRYAGAAAELDAAILVNPYDPVSVAGSMNKAFAMSLGERKERWRAMMDVLERNTVSHWWQSFVGVLAAMETSEAAGSAAGLGATA